ncbi:MAG: T9SS type A sorting domain-containing protein [Bacteroidota bacterium]|nr:T9SS type A sorting domain-containing protein [Bacteroidota bacterium]MDP4233384.1 T9SS type A sorting domain-containing protein [Bacteroidota bacterium]MDP4242250.1 T9SS type A sorting domain-containing protein [Bacteroidota bacterium]MDP4287006.1 T9SS type A sorting domain-containing protein [Bacteroidota bacterium]
MSRSFIILALASALAVCTLPSRSFAQSNVGPLELDSGFAAAASTPGKIESAAGGTSAEVTCYFANRFSLDVLAGGKIYDQTNNGIHFGLLFYDVYGNPLPGFGTNGMANVSWSGTNDYPLQLLLMPDNSVFAVGGSTNSVAPSQDSSFPTLYHLKSDGTPDATFEGTGRRSFAQTIGHGEFGSIDSVSIWVGTTKQQRFVAMGYVGGGLPGAGFSIAWFDTTGTLESRFGNGGLTRVSAAVHQVHGFQLPSHRYLLIGVADTTGEILLSRLDTNGRPDSTFGVNALLRPGIVPNSTIISIFSARDKYLYVVAAPDSSTHIPYAIFRFDTNGVLDHNYGSNGYATDPVLSKVVPKGITLTNDGSILLAGEMLAPVTPGGHTVGAAMKFFGKGLLDSSFGVNGLTLLDADMGTRRNQILSFVPVGKLTGNPHAGRFIAIGNSFPSGNVSNFLLSAWTQVPIFKFSTSTLDFGDVDTGSSLTKSFTFVNFDSVSHFVDSIAVLGPQIFSVVSPLGRDTIGPGQTETVIVAYRPHVIGRDSNHVSVFTHGGFPDIVTVYGTGVASSSSVAMTPAITGSLWISPNPVGTTARIDVTNDEIEHVMILDVLGRTVESYTTGTTSGSTLGEFQFDVTEIPNGVYFCNVTTKRGTQTVRFTVEH